MKTSEEFVRRKIVKTEEEKDKKRFLFIMMVLAVVIGGMWVFFERGVEKASLIGGGEEVMVEEVCKGGVIYWEVDVAGEEVPEKVLASFKFDSAGVEYFEKIVGEGWRVEREDFEEINERLVFELVREGALKEGEGVIYVGFKGHGSSMVEWEVVEVKGEKALTRKDKRFLVTEECGEVVLGTE